MNESAREEISRGVFCTSEKRKAGRGYCYGWEISRRDGGFRVRLLPSSSTTRVFVGTHIIMTEEKEVLILESKPAMDEGEAVMIDAPQRAPEAQLHVAPTSVPGVPGDAAVPAEKPSSGNETGSGVAKESNAPHSEEQRHVAASAATAPAAVTGVTPQNTITCAPEAVAAKPPAATEGDAQPKEASMPLPPVSRPASAPSPQPLPSKPAPSVPSNTTNTTNRKRNTNKTDDFEKLAFDAFRSELIANGDFPFKSNSESEKSRRDREFYIQRRWRALSNPDRRPYYLASKATGGANPLLKVDAKDNGNGHLFSPPERAPQDELLRAFEKLPSNLSAEEYAFELMKANRRNEIRAHFSHLNETGVANLLYKTWRESEMCRSKWIDTAKRMMEQRRVSASGNANTANNRQPVQPQNGIKNKAVAKHRGTRQASEPTPRFDFAIIDKVR